MGRAVKCGMFYMFYDMIFMAKGVVAGYKTRAVLKQGAPFDYRT